MIKDSHLATALLTKRRQLALSIEELQAKIDQLRADLIHIDGTIALIDPDLSIEDDLSNRRHYRRNGYFSHGELARRCLEALRLSKGAPVAINSIVATALSDKGLNPGDARLRKDFHNRLTMSMNSLARQKGLVERVGSNRNIKWKFREDVAG